MTESPQEKKKRKTRRRGRGEGTVYQRSDGRWAAEISLEDGRRKTLYGKTQEAVIQKLRQAQFEQKQGILATGPKQKLADHLTYWLEQVKKRYVRPATYVRYRRALNVHILPALGHLSLNKVTLRTIQQFYNRKLDEGQSISYVSMMRNILHQAFEHAVKERLIVVNPCHGASLPTRKDRDIPLLTAEQARQLLQAAQGTVLEAFIALAVMVGLRHGELLALQWQDIDFTQRTLSVHHSLTVDYDNRDIIGDPKTKTSERVILLPRPGIDVLLAHRARQKEDRLKAGPKWEHNDLVFSTSEGKRLQSSNVRRRFYRLLARIGLPRMHVHDLRHSASTLLRSMGVDLKVIQQILGHSKLDITANVYSHVLPTMQQEAVEKMEIMFEKPF